MSDTTGRPDPKYFRLWETIRESLEPGEFLPGKARKPKPDVIYREAEGALQQIAGQWVERFNLIENAAPGQEHVPPVLIVVCDNTDIAEVFYRKISGETQEEIVTEADIAEAARDGDNEDDDRDTGRRRRGKKSRKTVTVYGEGAVYPEHFSNTSDKRHTIRIDTHVLDAAERDETNKTKRDAADALRRIVSSVGKRGQPGEHVRCVVSVMMLTEGWDANNVTDILGVRAFGTQLLCEQVVGRGLRRMDYNPDPTTGLLTAEYVDVYGIPFSVIPFKGRASKAPAPEDKPKNHVLAMPERSRMEIRFPVVEGYAFALTHNLIRCDVDAMDPFVLELNDEPTATFVLPTTGYQEGHRARLSGPMAFEEQNREKYYRQTHIQAIQFQMARLLVDQLAGLHNDTSGAKGRVLRLQSRHQLFPQVFGYVSEYVDRKVDFLGCHPCELGLEKYVMRIVERLRDAIVPDESEGEPPLMPVLNRYKPMGTTAEVDFKTTRTCQATRKSHINQVVADTRSWEQVAQFKLEQSDVVRCYARNDHLGLVIPYEYQGIGHGYEPDFLVRLADDRIALVEVKGFEDDQVRAKHSAAKRWVAAVNNWGQLGSWTFHVCRNPQLLHRELAHLAAPATASRSSENPKVI